MSDWDFLWGLEGEELMAAMESGVEYLIPPEPRERKTSNPTKTKQRNKKKNLVLLIDAENISYTHTDKIMAEIRKIGELDEARYYLLQGGNSCKNWKKAAKRHGITASRIHSKPAKNIVDHEIIEDAKQILKQNKNIDIFCIAAGDGDYTSLVSNLREHKKRVVILAQENTAQELKAACNQYIPL